MPYEVILPSTIPGRRLVPVHVSNGKTLRVDHVGSFHAELLVSIFFVDYV
jgi:hypothetical protein